MSVAKFIDTNVLVYAYDLQEPKKRPVALKVVEDGFVSGTCAVSVQVLQELYANLERKGIPQNKTEQILSDIAGWMVVENTVDLFFAALKEKARWNISLWDSLILAAAKESGAAELITEDFSDGQDYGGVRALNPFK
jgi:predicted nucleic acid-binding protein